MEVFMKIKTLRVLITTILCVSCAGDRGIKIKNETMMPINIVVRAKENKAPTNPVIISRVVNPGSETIVDLAQPKDFRGVTFSIQGTTVTGPGLIPLTTNECIFSSSNAASVVFTSKMDGTIICGVTQIRN